MNESRSVFRLPPTKPRHIRGDRISLTDPVSLRQSIHMHIHRSTQDAVSILARTRSANYFIKLVSFVSDYETIHMATLVSVRRIGPNADVCLVGCSALWSHHGDVHPADGGRKHLWNVSKFIADFMAQWPIRQPSSYWSLCCYSNNDSEGSIDVSNVTKFLKTEAPRIVDSLLTFFFEVLTFQLTLVLNLSNANSSEGVNICNIPEKNII
jgi:hypothetical protein